jgi:hypothetical protein
MYNTLNTLQQDLFWMAKNLYKSGTLTRLESMKVICTYHLHAVAETITAKIVADILISSFVVPEIILPGRQALARFLANTQATVPYAGDYHEVLCQRLFDQLITALTAPSIAQKPLVDSVLQALLDTQSAIKDIRTLPPITT